MEYQFYSLAYFVLRVVLGILFTFQGYDKLFKLKPQGVFYATKNEYETMHVPDWFIKFSIVISSLIEFITGILLILGLFKVLAFTLISINMIMVAVGFSFLKPMWDMRYYFPRLIIFIIICLIDSSYDIFSLDFFLNK